MLSATCRITSEGLSGAGPVEALTPADRPTCPFGFTCLSVWVHLLVRLGSLANFESVEHYGRTMYEVARRPQSQPVAAASSAVAGLKGSRHQHPTLPVDIGSFSPGNETPMIRYVDIEQPVDLTAHLDPVLSR